MQLSQWFQQQLQTGAESFLWVIIKTYQHTLEHTDETLRAYL